MLYNDLCFGSTFPTETFFWLLWRLSFAVFPVAKKSGVWLQVEHMPSMVFLWCGRPDCVCIGSAASVSRGYMQICEMQDPELSSQGFIQNSSKLPLILLTLQLYEQYRLTPTDIYELLCYKG